MGEGLGVRELSPINLLTGSHAMWNEPCAINAEWNAESAHLTPALSPLRGRRGRTASYPDAASAPSMRTSVWVAKHEGDTLNFITPPGVGRSAARPGAVDEGSWRYAAPSTNRSAPPRSGPSGDAQKNSPRTH